VGLEIVNDAPEIKNNQIYGNQKGNLENNSDSEIDAANNWWGTTDQSEIATNILDYFHDAQKGIVNFEPYLMEKPAGN
jgi:hypothetical protein